VEKGLDLTFCKSLIGQPIQILVFGITKQIFRRKPLSWFFAKVANESIVAGNF
jgi:hypothetical protein